MTKDGMHQEDEAVTGHPDEEGQPGPHHEVAEAAHEPDQEHAGRPLASILAEEQRNSASLWLY